jgi:tRNA (guanine26-N2/guanine27-N2)-dimethyltransferase
MSSSLAAYGAYVRPMPYSNEVGLRMLIGGAVREASVLGYYITPLFSYYSYHGPVFRVMLRVNRGKLLENRWSFC